MNSRKIPTQLMTLIACLCVASFYQIGYGQCALETWKLLAEDGVEYDNFGESVAICGTTAVVGVPEHVNDNGVKSGAAYLFDTSTGVQIAKLEAEDAAHGDLFGCAVAISDTVAIVGAEGDDENGRNSGAVYVFDSSTGLLITKLMADVGDDYSSFGKSVAISGNTVIIGDWGTAYLFDLATGSQTNTLMPVDGESSFGYSVAINGTTAIIGAIWGDRDGEETGAAYLYDTTTGTQLAKLVPTGAAVHDYFGYSVAISETKAIVGAIWDDEYGHNVGSAYLYNIPTGTQIAKLSHSDAGRSDEFGRSVAISDTIAIVGVPQYCTTHNETGSAFLFDTTTGEQVGRFRPIYTSRDDRFGLSLAIDGTKVIGGSVGDRSIARDSGAAVLFEVVDVCPPHLRLDPIPIFTRYDVTFTAYNMTPYAPTFLAYSLAGSGSTYITSLNITIGLATPQQAGRMEFADQDGVAEWDLQVPDIGIGHHVWFQACQYEAVTNVVDSIIEY